MTPDLLIAEARKWIDTPFRHQGRALGRGVDCLGVIAMSAKAAGLAVEDRTNYGHQPAGVLMPELARQMIRVPRDAMRPGDVLLMRYDQPQHLALLSSDSPLAIIHAYASARTTLEQPLDVHLAMLVWAVFRFREFA